MCQNLLGHRGGKLAGWVGTKKGKPQDDTSWSRWWFQMCFIFTPIWGNDPIRLLFFKWVEKPPTSWWLRSPAKHWLLFSGCFVVVMFIGGHCTNSKTLEGSLDWFSKKRNPDWNGTSPDNDSRWLYIYIYIYSLWFFDSSPHSSTVFFHTLCGIFWDGWVIHDTNMEGYIGCVP